MNRYAEEIYLTLFLIFALVVTCIICYLYFAQKTANQRRKIMFLSYQLEELKNKIKEQNTIMNDISITYKCPDAHSAETIGTTNLFIAPLENSMVLSKLSSGTKVEILDSAEILSVLWYEILLPSQTKINNKGWVKKERLTNFDSI